MTAREAIQWYNATTPENRARVLRILDLVAPDGDARFGKWSQEQWIAAIVTTMAPAASSEGLEEIL